MADVRLDYAGGEHWVQAASGDVSPLSELRYAHFDLLATQARELKIWAHRIAPDGNSEALPGLLTLHNDGVERQFDLRLSGGQVLVPIAGGACRLILDFADR